MRSQAISSCLALKLVRLYRPQKQPIMATTQSYESSCGTQANQEKCTPNFHPCFSATEIVGILGACFKWKRLRGYIIDFTLPMLTLLTLSQYLRVVLFGKASINDGDPGGRCPGKHLLWGIKKTMLGMIATAATIVWPFLIDLILFLLILHSATVDLCLWSRYHLQRDRSCKRCQLEDTLFSVQIHILLLYGHAACRAVSLVQ
jgi:hypothetical protein